MQIQTKTRVANRVTIKRPRHSSSRAQAVFGRAIGAMGLGALAVGVTAMGAVAIGALAIRALAVKRERSNTSVSRN
jgi:cell division septal protein FtsQ